MYIFRYYIFSLSLSLYIYIYIVIYFYIYIYVYIYIKNAICIYHIQLYKCHGSSTATTTAPTRTATTTAPAHFPMNTRLHFIWIGWHQRRRRATCRTGANAIFNQLPPLPSDLCSATRGLIFWRYTRTSSAVWPSTILKYRYIYIYILYCSSKVVKNKLCKIVQLN